MENTAPTTTPRPTLVTLLAVFTFIGTAAYFGWLLLGWLVPQFAQQEDWPLWVVVTICIGQAGKFVAAILLLKMRRMGFFLYTGMELVSATMGIIGSKVTMDYMDSSYVSPDLQFDPKIMVIGLLCMSIGLSIIYIGGFASHLSKMH